MNYSRPPFPRSLFARFCKLALDFGFTKRGQRWVFLAKLFDYAEAHPLTFRKR